MDKDFKRVNTSHSFNQFQQDGHKDEVLQEDSVYYVEKGRTYHNGRLGEDGCEPGWDKIYWSPDEGTWVYNASAGDALIDIKFCPHCGIKLKEVGVTNE